jgi:hypothetical protein
MYLSEKRLWKVRIMLATLLFLYLLIECLSVPAVYAHERVSKTTLSGIIVVQATPTEDATVTALNKEKLAQEVQQLENQNAPGFSGWLQTNIAILLSTLTVVIGALIGLWRWLGDRRSAQTKELEDRQSEREKRAEERFQKAIEGLGSKDPEARAGAAIMLRTFLKPGYEPFYQQVFDLAVTHLRFRLPTSPQNPGVPDSLSQALITVFKEAVVCVRVRLEKENIQRKDYKNFLDASRVRLDGASLDDTDLSHVFLREASLIETHLDNANLTGALLMGVDFTGADLWGADLTEASLDRANPEDASALEHTKFYRASGLSPQQVGTCTARGALF